LPAIVGLFYLIISLPFFLKVITASDDTIYFLLAFLNIPASIVFDLFFDLTVSETNLAFLLTSLIFWVGFSAITGWIIDLKKNGKIKSVTIRVFLVPIIPLIARIVYSPIDMLITVRLFGCGCNPGFNANSFNFLFVLPLVGGISLLELIRTARGMKGVGKWIFVVICIAFQITTGFICWHWFGWA